MPGDYFSVSQEIVGGIWFPPGAQPPFNCNVAPYNVSQGQPFNFSVYAKYLSILDPSLAVMTLGFRWYYSDGTWVETSTNYNLTTDYERYAISPADGSNDYLSEPPQRPLTGEFPNQMFPFVRFPLAPQGNFLLNSAMLSPTVSMPPFMDGTTINMSTGDYLQDPVTGAAYYFPGRSKRLARINSEIYRWIPLSTTYSVTYMAGSVMPPLDPTLW